MLGLSIDLDALGDVNASLVALAILLAIGIAAAVIRRRLDRSPVDRIMLQQHFDVPMPSGSILDQDNTRSARRAAPAGLSSGGDAKPYQGAAAAGPSSWRGQRAH